MTLHLDTCAKKLFYNSRKYLGSRKYRTAAVQLHKGIVLRIKAESVPPEADQMGRPEGPVDSPGVSVPTCAELSIFKYLVLHRLTNPPLVGIH